MLFFFFVLFQSNILQIDLHYELHTLLKDIGIIANSMVLQIKMLMWGSHIPSRIDWACWGYFNVASFFWNWFFVKNFVFLQQIRRLFRCESQKTTSQMKMNIPNITSDLSKEIENSEVNRTTIFIINMSQFYVNTKKQRHRRCSGRSLILFVRFNVKL